MPHTPANVTRASRIMLPAHAALSIGLGLSWLSAPTGPSAGLQAIAMVWPLRDTGIVLLVFGLTELAAYLILGNRDVNAVALVAGALVFAGLAVMAVLGHVHGSSWGGVVVWVYIAVAHIASTVSLAYFEGAE